MAGAAFDPHFLVDLFAPFARVTTRRMFSGHAVYRDGVVFALALRDGLYLKADAETVPLFRAEGLAPFSYEVKGGEKIVTSYWRMPDACLDDEEDLRRWAAIAWQAAVRAPRKPSRRKLAHKP
jgi:DNA transformation protein